VVLPTKPLIPNLRDLVKIGADFSATANVTVRFRTDLQRWEVSARENSRVSVYEEDGSLPNLRTVTLPVAGGAFAISVGFTSAAATGPDQPEGEELRTTSDNRVAFGMRMTCNARTK
jgi:hypothetical protein